MREAILARAIADTATPLDGTAAALDPLIERIGDARLVLLGEATHGTHEFYRIRAELTKRLIREKGFGVVAVEADWPDAARVDRYIRGLGCDAEAIEALDTFRRFPQWMWRNADVLDFVGWLRAHNDHVHHRGARRKVGFYGLDLFSLYASIGIVIDILERRDPDAAADARERYGCFDVFGDDPQLYGHATAHGHITNCEAEVVEQLVALEEAHRSQLHAGLATDDDLFEALQNARIVARAEQYYRSMYGGSAVTWNLRDMHMMDTLDALAEHLGGDAGGAPAKIVVWAHNSHVGDAGATDRVARGETSLGQLCRIRHPDDTVLVGFTTYGGTVTAASDWGRLADMQRIRPALAGSCEELFHETGVPRFLLMLDRLGEAAGALHEPRLQRAIGVVYRPQTERPSHYFHAALPRQFDAVIHIDETRAVEPLERSGVRDRFEPPETYPTGL